MLYEKTSLQLVLGMDRKKLGQVTAGCQTLNTSFPYFVEM